MKTRTKALQISGAILLGMMSVAATAQTPDPGAGYVNEDQTSFRGASSACWDSPASSA